MFSALPIGIGALSEKTYGINSGFSRRISKTPQSNLLEEIANRMLPLNQVSILDGDTAHQFLPNYVYAVYQKLTHKVTFVTEIVLIQVLKLKHE